MVVSCAAYNCTARFSKSKALSFHCFPKNPELQKQWILATKRMDFKVTAGSRLCGKHFLPQDYIDTILNDRKRLRKNAVPSVFEFPRDLQRKPALGRKNLLESTFIPNSEPIPSTSRSQYYEHRRTTSSNTESANVRKNKKKRYIIYPGDFSLQDMQNKKKAMLMYKMALKQLERRSGLIKNLQKKNRRQLHSIQNLRRFIKSFEKVKKYRQSR